MMEVKSYNVVEAPGEPGMILISFKLNTGVNFGVTCTPKMALAISGDVERVAQRLLPEQSTEHLAMGVDPEPGA
jgi:hypothetical protein